MYQYHFPNSYRRFRPDNVCGQQIHFVYSELISDPDSVHVDNVEINDYVWADLKNVNKYIKRKEYREIVDKLIAGRVQ
jgi:hypothetical protein